MSVVETNTPRRQRVLTTIGVALILAGLGFLGYVGWQYYGTDVVSKHKQAEVRKSLVLNWDKGIDGDAIGLLRIERFGKDYEVPIVPTFEKSALAGHRVTHGEPFRDFLKLRKGDDVVVETRTQIFTYKLLNNGTDITVDFTTSWPLQAVPIKGKANAKPTKPMLTMLTCSELFHTRDRSVVLGDLVKTIDKTKGSSG